MTLAAPVALVVFAGSSLLAQTQKNSVFTLDGGVAVLYQVYSEASPSDQVKKSVL
jgi:hypothetical protein